MFILDRCGGRCVNVSRLTSYEVDESRDPGEPYTVLRVQAVIDGIHEIGPAVEMWGIRFGVTRTERHCRVKRTALSLVGAKLDRCQLIDWFREEMIPSLCDRDKLPVPVKRSSTGMIKVDRLSRVTDSRERTDKLVRIYETDPSILACMTELVAWDGRYAYRVEEVLDLDVYGTIAYGLATATRCGCN